MAFIDNKDKPLIIHNSQIGSFKPFVFFADITHLLNRSNYQGVCRICTLQLSNQDVRILSLLDSICFLLLCESGTCKVTIFLQGLRSQLNAIHKENHLVGILRCCNQLC